MIELADEVSTNHEKQWKRQSPKYIVAIPSSMDEQNLTLELPKQLAK
ncbi:MAG: hypothetical protein H6765_04050 [Candidatus Peribacteria bacterium]|nr:MAG: hypothetical protein H6765_04050 [Candidatus Peribacteria bacterium]